MIRKIVKLGSGAYTITLPIQWIREQNLQTGDEIELESLEDNALTLKTRKKQHKVKEITLTIPLNPEYLNVVLGIAYNAGYDKIVLNYKGPSKPIFERVSKKMIGFEVIEADKGRYIIRCVAEPVFEDLDKITLRLIYIMKEILENFPGDRLMEDHNNTINRYSGLLLRSTAKKMFSHDLEQFVTHCFSSFVHVAKTIHKVDEYLGKHNKKLSNTHKLIVDDMKIMIEGMQKGFMKSDVAPLVKERNLGMKVYSLQEGSRDAITTQLLLAYRSLHISIYYLIAIVMLKK